MWKAASFILRKIFGSNLSPAPTDLDRIMELKVSAEEAKNGTEKPVKFKLGKENKKIMVKIPAGIKSGNRIRLSGMGKSQDGRVGDLYLLVKVKV